MSTGVLSSSGSSQYIRQRLSVPTACLQHYICWLQGDASYTCQQLDGVLCYFHWCLIARASADVVRAGETNTSVVVTCRNTDGTPFSDAATYQVLVRLLRVVDADPYAVFSAELCWVRHQLVFQILERMHEDQGLTCHSWHA